MMERHGISDLELGSILAESVLDGGSIPKNGNHTEEHLSMLAFTVWLYEAGRDVEETARIVSERAQVPVTAEDVRGWRGGGDWGLKGTLTNQALVQGKNSIVQGTFAFATIKAVSSLLSAIQSPTSTWAEKIRASVAVLDRGGFPPLLRGELFTGITVGTGTEDMTDDELRAAWESYSSAVPQQPANEMEQRHGDTSAIDTFQEREYFTSNRLSPLSR